MKHLYAALLMAVLLVGCGGLQKQVDMTSGAGESVAILEARSFAFEPNNVRTGVDSVIVFKITNVAGSSHNFSIEDPDGNVLKSVALPAGETTEVRVVFPEAGTYRFFCNKPLHGSLGMTGQVEVVER